MFGNWWIIWCKTEPGSNRWWKVSSIWTTSCGYFSILFTLYQYTFIVFDSIFVQNQQGNYFLQKSSLPVTPCKKTSVVMFILCKSLSNIFVNCKLIKTGACIAVSKTNFGSLNINDGYKVVVCTAHFHLIYEFPKIKAQTQLSKFIYFRTS